MQLFGTDCRTEFKAYKQYNVTWYCHCHCYLSIHGWVDLSPVICPTGMWVDWCQLAEVAYNNAPHAITGISPFFATHGYNPLVTVCPDAEVTDLCT